MGPCMSIFVDGGFQKSNPSFAEAASAPSSSSQSINTEVIFFPDNAMPCRHAKNCHRKGCKYAHGITSLVRFLEMIGNAKETLDICVFNITCNEIASAIIARHKAGVKVRVITDNDQADSRGSDIDEFRHNGISVVMDNSEQLMHNKFAIIDHKQVLTGSFNWTRTAVLQNKENVLITNQSNVVQSYESEFMKLWKDFS